MYAGRGRGFRRAITLLLTRRAIGAGGRALRLSQFVGGQLFGLVLVGLRFLLFFGGFLLPLSHDALLQRLGPNGDTTATGLQGPAELETGSGGRTGFRRLHLLVAAVCYDVSALIAFHVKSA